MIPQIVQIGPLPINSFGLCIALAILAGMHLLSSSFQKHGLPPSLAERYVLAGGFSGLLGARVWYLLTDWEPAPHQSLVDGILSGGGFVFLGGFVFGAAVLLAMSQLDGIKVSALTDACGPTLMFAYGIGRLGCQLSGDGDYGMETSNHFLGMSYSHGVVPTPPGVLVYPTPLYESIMAFISLGILIQAENRRPIRDRPMVLTALYLLLMSTARFSVEFLRIEPRYELGLSQAQWISLILFALGALLMALSYPAAVRPQKKT